MHWTLAHTFPPGADGAALWRPESALKSIELRATLDVRGAGAFRATLGRRNEWAACGVVEVELDAAAGSVAGWWAGGQREVALFRAPWNPPAEGTADLVVELDDAPPFAYAVLLDDEAIASGSYAAPLGFRPYAVTPQEVALRWSGGVAPRAATARLGARPAPIVALGDSQIHGGRTLDALHARGVPHAINAGQAGSDTAGALARLESDALAFAPSHLLLWMGSNDLRYAERRGETEAAGIAIAERNIASIVAAARGRCIAPALVGPLPRGGSVEVAHLNGRLADLAAGLSMPYYDVYEVLHHRNHKLDIRFSDGLHPNAAGAEKLADVLNAAGLCAALAAR